MREDLDILFKVLLMIIDLWFLIRLNKLRVGDISMKVLKDENDILKKENNYLKHQIHYLNSKHKQTDSKHDNLQNT